MFCRFVTVFLRSTVLSSCLFYSYPFLFPKFSKINKISKISNIINISKFNKIIKIGNTSKIRQISNISKISKISKIKATENFARQRDDLKHRPTNGPAIFKTSSKPWTQTSANLADPSARGIR